MDLKKGFQEVPVTMLVKADWNYKVDDVEKEKKLVANIRRNGQVENLIVRQLTKNKLEVVNGNHRLAAFQVLGISKAMVFNTGRISTAAAKRLAIETNETKFDSDPLRLADMLEEITSEFAMDTSDLLESFPMTPDEIEAAMQLPKHLAEQAAEPSPTTGNEGDNPYLGDEVSATKLLSALGVSSFSKEESELIASVVLQEKERLGSRVVSPKNGGNAAFVSIFRQFSGAKLEKKKK